MTQQRNNENNENNKGGRQKCMVSILEGFKGKETKDGRTCIVQLHPWRCETWTWVGFDQRYCFMKGHVDGVHFGDQLTWSTVLAPWSYFCWLNASNGPHQKVDRPQLDLVGGDCQSNRGRRWGTQVLACAIEVVWKIMKWCSFLDQVDSPKNLCWFTTESWCDCRVQFYLQWFLFVLRGLREWGGLLLRRLSLKNSLFAIMWVFQEIKHQPSLEMVQNPIKYPVEYKKTRKALKL